MESHGKVLEFKGTVTEITNNYLEGQKRKKESV